MTHFRLIIGLGLSAISISCGGGGGGTDPIIAPPNPPAPPTYVTKDYTITMSEASVKRISNGDPVDLSIEGIEASGTVVVTQ